MISEDKENYEKHLYQESHDLVVNQIDINLEEIDEEHVDHVHGIDISPRVKQLKQEFNFTTNVYRDLVKIFNDPWTPH